MSIWTNWDPLEEVIVGDCYQPGSMDWLVAADARDSFNQILAETQEDLDGIAKCLTRLGVQVHRPDLAVTSQPYELPGFNIHNPMAPIVPRDQYLAYGDTIYQTYTSMTDRYLDAYNYYKIFNTMFDQGYNWISQPPPAMDPLDSHENWQTDGEYIYNNKLADRLFWHTATMFKCGDTIITNTAGPGTQRGLDWMRRNLPGINIIENSNTSMGNWGHIDHGYFMIDDETVVCKTVEWVPECLRNKRILEVGLVKEDRIFPTILNKIQNSYSDHAGKYSTGRIEQWLTQWKGYSQHTQFDTNVLVVDSKNVLFSNNVPQKLFDLLDSLGVQSHVCNQRHGYFWEGGVHCFTLDLKRTGQKRQIVHRG